MQVHGAFSHTLCGSIGAVQPKFSAEGFLESTRMTSPWPKVRATWYPESGLPCLSGDCGLISKWIKCVILKKVHVEPHGKIMFQTTGLGHHLVEGKAMSL
jgi:hypothetical protein